MLFKEVHLQGIRSGTVSLAFRNWEKATVNKGSLLKTSIGLVEVVNIKPIDQNKITRAHAVKAGYENKDLLLKSLRQNTAAKIYKIALRYYSEDPRIKLREQTELSGEKLEELKGKLSRLDQYSSEGSWTKKVLLAIKRYPHKRAVELAEITGYKKEWLKLNIRKLKNLGLTISHEVGYELSPLGKALLQKLPGRS